MKTYISKATIIILFLLVVPTEGMRAQLSQEEIKELRIRVKNKIEEFQCYLMHLADKTATDKTLKTESCILAVKLFIGECEEYMMYRTERNAVTGALETQKVRHAPVRMRVSSIYREDENKPLMKTYLYRLRDETTIYDQVEMTHADAVRVDNVYKVGDHYECMAYFCQKYVGLREGRVAYSDITNKKVRIYIKPVQIPMPDGKTRIIWNAYLGDIYVVDTRAI